MMLACAFICQNVFFMNSSKKNFVHLEYKIVRIRSCCHSILNPTIELHSNSRCFRDAPGGPIRRSLSKRVIKISELEKQEQAICVKFSGDHLLWVPMLEINWIISVIWTSLLECCHRDLSFWLVVTTLTPKALACLHARSQGETPVIANKSRNNLLTVGVSGAVGGRGAIMDSLSCYFSGLSDWEKCPAISDDIPEDNLIWRRTYRNQY